MPGSEGGPNAKVSPRNGWKEGVEYDWAAAKGFYCRLPLFEKRSKAKFREAVSRCLDTDYVLTISRQRMFSRRAREYMVAYNALNNDDEKKIPGKQEIHS